VHAHAHVQPTGYQSTRHKWAHNKAISCQSGSAHCPANTVLNIDDKITANEQTIWGSVEN